MKLLTIEDEIKDIDNRIEKSMSELYEKASDYKAERSRNSGVLPIIIGSMFLLSFGLTLLSSPISALETTALYRYITMTLLGAILTGTGITIVANPKKIDKVLSKDELKYYVERGGNIEIKEMYDRVEKLFVIREHLIEKQEREMVSTVQVSTPIEPMKQPQLIHNDDKVRRRKKDR